MKVAQHPNCRHLPVQMTEKNLLHVHTLTKFAHEEREQICLFFFLTLQNLREVFSLSGLIYISLKKCRNKSILMLR